MAEESEIGSHAAVKYLDARALGDLTPRAALVRQVLLAAAAIERAVELRLL
jgi:hypothetical protein